MRKLPVVFSDFASSSILMAYCGKSAIGFPFNFYDSVSLFDGTERHLLLHHEEAVELVVLFVLVKHNRNDLMMNNKKPITAFRDGALNCSDISGNVMIVKVAVLFV